MKSLLFLEDVCCLSAITLRDGTLSKAWQFKATAYAYILHRGGQLFIITATRKICLFASVWLVLEPSALSEQGEVCVLALGHPGSECFGLDAYMQLPSCEYLLGTMQGAAAQGRREDAAVGRGRRGERRATRGGA